MRGHIVKRGKDSYSIVVELGHDATGKRKQQWVSVKGTKKDAEKRLGDMLHQLDTGTFMKPGKTTFADFAFRWLQEYARPNLAPKTTEGYDSIIRRHLVPALGSVVLSQLKPEHLQKLYTEKLSGRLSARTVRYIHVTAHVILHTAQKWGLLSRNVADSVTPPKQQRREMQTWDEDDIARFLEAAKSTPYYALFFTAIFTGARRCELLALRWQDLDLILGQVYVNRGLHQLKDGSIVFRPPKTARGRRTIALPPSAIMLIREHRTQQEGQAALLGLSLSDDSLVFAHVDGKPLLPDSVTHAWTKLARGSGLKAIRLHDARHTHASLMLKQGVHPKIVQERLGHSSVGITLDLYSHVAPGLQEAAAKRFDDLVAPKCEKVAVAGLR